MTCRGNCKRASMMGRYLHFKKTPLFGAYAVENNFTIRSSRESEYSDQFLITYGDTNAS